MKSGTVGFSGFVLLISFVGLFEFYRMALPAARVKALFASVVGTAFCLVLVLPGIQLLPAITFLVLFYGLCSLIRVRDVRNSAAETALLLMGALYIPLLLSHLALLRGLPHGTYWIFLMLLIVMSGDTGAFYVGSAIGKRKLYPAVSPNKSIEGMVGGLAGSLIGAFFAKAVFFHSLTPADCVATALLVGLAGQLGDLFESLLKRSFGVKDSGNIIPGHGGMLDRLDSILFAAPTLYIYASNIFY